MGPGRGTWWEQTYLRRAVKSEPLDVFFAPAYTAPLGLAIPLAVTIHDISFVAHPEWFRARSGMRRRWLTRRAADTASVVFTDSEFSRTELERHFRLPDLIAAFAEATADLPRARLVIVGDDHTWPPQDLGSVAARYGVSDRTDFLKYVPDAELATLYARSSVFGFLSEYEGFGLTPLEALSAGVPPVVLDTAVAREVYDDAAVYVQPGDIAGTAAELRRFLLDPRSAAPILDRAPAVLGRYSWEVAAARTLEHIERIARS